MSKYIATFGEKEISIDVSQSGNEVTILEGNHTFKPDILAINSQHYHVVENGHSYNIRFVFEGSDVFAYINGELVIFKLEDARTLARRKSATAKAGAAIEGRVDLKAMMPGKIVSIKVKKGDEVKTGQGVIVVEAMKMENEMRSSHEVRVKEICVKQGDSVESGAILIKFEAP